mmetsp:Transcript_3578/g.6229  ORF Transcript_3578/g.6229 Transcript_3578/m.6229 type:complete len:215 (-) Transcript_3578:240-884(-)
MGREKGCTLGRCVVQTVAIHTWMLGGANPTLGRNPPQKYTKSGHPKWPQNNPILGQKTFNYLPAYPSRIHLKPVFFCFGLPTPKIQGGGVSTVELGLMSRAGRCQRNHVTCRFSGVITAAWFERRAHQFWRYYMSRGRRHAPGFMRRLGGCLVSGFLEWTLMQIVRNQSCNLTQHASHGRPFLPFFWTRGPMSRAVARESLHVACCVGTLGPFL